MKKFISALSFQSYAWLPLCLLAGMFFLMIGSSLHKKLAYDEYPNLYYGYRFISEGPLAQPDGQRMPILALNALGCRQVQCDSVALDQNESLRFLVRLPSMIFALLTAWLAGRWARELWGRWPGFLCLALCAFNPGFIAHGKEVTSDMATSFFVLLSMYLFWHWLHSRSLKTWSGLVLSVGACLVTKYSAMILFPVMGILFAADIFIHRKKLPDNHSVLITFFVQLFASAAALLLFINAVYLFQGSFLKAGEYHWQSKSYEQRLGSRSVRIPLPKVYTTGLDYTQYVSENPSVGRGNNYILGKRHRRGRWFAFPIMILLKTPLAFFPLLLMAIFLKVPRNALASFAMWVSFGIWLLIFSVACDLQLGIRYVIPALPFLFIFVSRIAANSVFSRTRIAAGLLTLWYAGSSLSYYPHTLSYFNELIGSRVNAYKYLSDSNLDWEDKTYFIEKFRNQHPEIPFVVNPGKPVPGYMVLGANDFTGVLDENQYAWVREHLKPIRHISYSHYLFYVPDSLFAELSV